MAYLTPTTNLHLKKPGGNEKPKIADINDNMDTIDAAIGALPSGTNLQAEISGLSTDLSAKAKVIHCTSTDNTWPKIWTKINALATGETATIYFHNTAYSAFSNNARTTGYPCGTITKLNTDTNFGLLLKTVFNEIISVYVTGANSSDPGTYSEKSPNMDKGIILNSENVTNDTFIFSLDDGCYQVASSTSLAPYLPENYGTLVVLKSSVTYAAFIFVSTTGGVYYRNRSGTNTWHYGWKKAGQTISIISESSSLETALSDNWMTDIPTSTGEPFLCRVQANNTVYFGYLSRYSTKFGSGVLARYDGRIYACFLNDSTVTVRQMTDTLTICLPKMTGIEIAGTASSAGTTPITFPAGAVPSGYGVWGANVLLRASGGINYYQLPYVNNNLTEFTVVQTVSNTGLVLNSKTTWTNNTVEAWITLYCKKT